MSSRVGSSILHIQKEVEFVLDVFLPQEVVRRQFWTKSDKETTIFSVIFVC